MNVRQMLESHPVRPFTDNVQALVGCIEECFACAQTCTTCADACLGEEEHRGMLVECIRYNLDCADVCVATGRMLSRQTEPPAELLRDMLQVCASACRVCGQECTQHAEMHEHCRICAESCSRCEDACNTLLAQR
nr:four-helix bundle copper-binding protein [Deltaproteobacteria bacterium]